MSLLKRVERAQQLADDPTAEAPVVAPPPLPPSAARVAAREELLLSIRLRLQDEVMGSFDSCSTSPTRPSSWAGSRRSSTA